MPILALLPFLCISKKLLCVWANIFCWFAFIAKTEPQCNYHPQMKSAKVMFLQVFVCPGWGLCPGGSLSRGLCPGDLCPGVPVQEGSLSKGSLCPWGSLSGRPPIRLRVGGRHPTGMHSCSWIDMKRCF